MSDSIRYAARKGFTYIEILIALVLIAALFVPVMRLFSHSLYSSTVSRDLMTATSLAKWRMERLKNLNFTKEQLLRIGDEVYPAADEPPVEMNGANWRIKRLVVKNGRPDGISLKKPVEIRFLVYRAKEMEPGAEGEPVATLVTLFEDTSWKEIRPVM